MCVFRFGDVFRKCFLVKLLLRTKLMSVDLSMACAEHIACNNTRVNCVDRTVCQVECTESENCPVNVSYNLSFSLSLSLLILCVLPQCQTVYDTYPYIYIYTCTGD